MDFFAVRFNMHQSVYTHKCVKAIEFMVRMHSAPHHTIPYQTAKNSCKHELLKPKQPPYIAPFFFLSFSLPFFLSLLRSFYLSLPPLLFLFLFPFLFFPSFLTLTFFLYLSIPLPLILSILQLTDALVLANDHIFITGSITPKYPTGRYT
jgi:hypothetical protein